MRVGGWGCKVTRGVMVPEGVGVLAAEDGVR
jgi:hypothetical protein